MALVYTPSNPIPGLELHNWDNLDTADSSPTSAEIGSTKTMNGFVQVIGTFGGGTVKLQGSNDGTNWVDLKDWWGTGISLTAAGGAEFRCSARYIRPLITGGTADDVDVFVTLRW